MRTLLLAILILGLTMTGCLNFESSKEKEAEKQEDNIEITIGEDVGKAVDKGISEGIAGMKEALSELEKSMQEANNGERVDPVDFRDLKELLPERINGMDRISSEGERSGWGGFKVSTAQAEYEDGDKRLDISIVDAGGMMGLAKIGLAAWAEAEVDRETEHGYERTTTIDGYKAFEKYDSRSENGEVSIIINERFIVNIEGRNIAERDLKRALRKLDLRKLERME